MRVVGVSLTLAPLASSICWCGVLRPKLGAHRCLLQNHMYKIIYLRHAKIASTSMLNYFGQCSPDRSEETGGPLARGCAAVGCMLCLPAPKACMHAAIAAGIPAASPAGARVPGAMPSLTGRLHCCLMLQAACAPGSSPPPFPQPRTWRPAQRICRWQTSARRRCGLTWAGSGLLTNVARRRTTDVADVPFRRHALQA